MKKFVSLLLAGILLLLCVPSLAEEYGWVNAETALRMSSSESAVKTGTLAVGTRVVIENEVTDEGGAFTWYQVTAVVTNEKGYVKSDDVDMVIAKKPLTFNDEKTPSVQNGMKVTDESLYPVLKASGLLDPQAAIQPEDLAKYQLLSENDSSDEVLNLRKRLKTLGYTTEATSKKFNSGLTKLLKKFQKVNGLEEDGLCTPELQARIYSNTALTAKGVRLTNDAIAITSASVKDK